MHRVSHIWRIFRTGLGWAVFGTASVTLGFIVLPLRRVVPGRPEERELRAQRALHWAARAYLRGLSLLWVLRLRSTGGERLREPGKLVVANHPTLLDAVFLMSLMPQADCVVKQQYFEMPFLGATARGAGYIPSGEGPGIVDRCVERLQRGRSVIIFPEGTRSPAGGLAPFARGAAHIALRAKCELIPVTIDCTPPTLYRGLPWWDVPESRFTMTLQVDEPLPVDELVAGQTSRGRAARVLTAAMRDHFERRKALVEV